MIRLLSFAASGPFTACQYTMKSTDCCFCTYVCVCVCYMTTKTKSACSLKWLSLVGGNERNAWGNNLINAIHGALIKCISWRCECSTNRLQKQQWWAEKKKKGGNYWKITHCVLCPSPGTVNKCCRSPSGAGTLCRQRPAIASDNIYAHQMQKSLNTRHMNIT